MKVSKNWQPQALLQLQYLTKFSTSYSVNFNLFVCLVTHSILTGKYYYYHGNGLYIHISVMLYIAVGNSATTTPGVQYIQLQYNTYEICVHIF